MILSILWRTPIADRYWGAQTNNWNGASGWFSDAALTTPAADPTSADDVKFVAGSFTGAGQTLTVNSTAYCKDMDWTGAANTPTFTMNANLNFYGDITLVSLMTYTYVFTDLTASGSGDISITSNGKNIGSDLVLASTFSGTLSLNDDCRVLPSLYPQGGTLNTNGHKLTLGKFLRTDSGLFTFNAGASTIDLLWGTAVDGWRYTGSGMTFNAGSSIIKVVGIAPFSGGGLTYNEVQLNGSAHTISGSNTFSQLNLSSGTTQTITFTDGTTQTIASPSLSGSAGHVHTLRGSSTGGWALAKSGGGTVTADYLNIQYGSTVANGVIWNPGVNSICDANTTGWDFWSLGTGKVSGVNPRSINSISCSQIESVNGV